MKSKKQVIGSLMLLFSAILWGLSYSVQSTLSKIIGNYTIIFLKAFSGFILFPICFLLKRKINEKTILYGVVVGFVNAVGLIFQQFGISQTTVSKSSFISGLYVIFVPIFGLFTKKKPKPRFWLAVVLAFFGMYLLCMQESLKINFADCILLLSCVFFALQIVLIDKYSSKVDPLPFCAVQQIVCSITAGLLMSVVEKPNINSIISVWPYILYIMFASGMVAQILQNKFQRSVAPTVASLIMSLESVFGVFGGWLFLNQTLTLKEGIGCLLMFIAVLVAE